MQIDKKIPFLIKKNLFLELKFISNKITCLIFFLLFSINLEYNIFDRKHSL